jgi:hypothetical protein
MKNSVGQQGKTSISLPLEGGGEVNFDNTMKNLRRSDR